MVKTCSQTKDQRSTNRSAATFWRQYWQRRFHSLRAKFTKITAKMKGQEATHKERPRAPQFILNRRDTPPGLLPVVVSPYDWCSPLSFTILPPLLGQLADPSFFVLSSSLVVLCRMPGCASYSIPDGPSERTLWWLRFPVRPDCASFHG